MITELNIKYFLCLAETLSFTEVGKRMYISQQAVSKHIAGLEDDLGVKLLNRSRNSVELTEAGLQYYNFFRSAADEYQALRQSTRRQDALRMDTLRVGYQNWLDFGPAPGVAMASLRETNPQAFLLGERHEPSKLLKMLDERELDMIVVHKRFLPKLDGLQSLPLITAPMQVVVSARNPLCRPGASFRDFCHEPLLIDSFEGESPEAVIRRARRECRSYGFEPSEIVPVPNRDSIYTSAELGRGIYFGSCMAVLSQGAALARYDTDVTETLCCVWRSDGGSDCLSRYARCLQKEYRRCQAHYCEHRSWDPD